MKLAYSSPTITDLGSVSQMTRAMGGAYGEFVQPGENAEGMNMMNMMMMMGGDD
jgi:hypothetical protein